MIERLQELAAEALESARKWGNLAQYHHSQGEAREATRAQGCADNARSYAHILAERIESLKAGG